MVDHCFFSVRTASAWRLRRWVLAIIVGLSLNFSSPVGAQQNAVQTQERLEQNLPADRRATATLRSIQQRVGSEPLADVTTEVRQLMSSDPHLMVKLPDASTFIPMYSAVFRIWKKLPAAARLKLTESNETVSAEVLRDILAKSQLESLPEFLLRYTGTRASFEAHLVLARLHLDRGHDCAAAFWLKALEHPSIPDDFRLAAQAATSQIQLRRQVGAIGAPAAIGAKKIPQHLVWQQRPLVSPQLRLQLEKFSKAAHAAGRGLQSSWAERQAESITYRKTMRGVSAIDVRTGLTLWQYALSPDLDAAVTSDVSNNAAFRKVNLDTISNSVVSDLDATAVANMFFRNEVLTRLSTDDERVYVVGSDHLEPTSRRGARGAFVIPNRKLQEGGSGRLIALEKSTGRRVWTASAAALRDTFIGDSDRLWIAGPPAVSRGNLYLVLESAGEIFLTCLHSQTGEVNWKRLLAFPEQPIQKDPVRQLRGAEPLVASGLIWCFTTTDRIVCVDELTHGVTWVGHLPTNTETQRRYASGRGRPVVLTAGAPLSRRWARSEQIVVGETLVVMSPQSHEIFRFNSVSGQPLESISVNPTAALMHIDGARLLIAESRRLYLLDATTATTIWSVSLADDFAVPSARAVLTDGRYLVPLGGGSLLALDSADGRVLETTERLLPLGPCGQLFAVDDGSGDLLYAAPDRLLRLSTRASDQQVENPLEVVAGLMSAGRWQEALQLIDELDARQNGKREVQRLRFECLMQMSLSLTGDGSLATLKEVARTDEQKTLVRVLEVTTLIRSGQMREAAIELIEILSLRPERLSTQTPTTDRVLKLGLSGGDFSAVDRPLGAWAGNRLSKLLPNLQGDGEIADRLFKLSSSALLLIDDSSIRSYLCAAAKGQASAETCLHLIRHSLSVAAATDADIAIETQVLSDLLIKFQNNALSGVDAARKAILEIALLEFPPAVVKRLQDVHRLEFTSERGWDDEFRTAMMRRCLRWSPQSFRAVPVTRNTSSANRNAVMLSTAVSDDLFLRRFQWSVIRGDFGRLVALSDDQRWSIPGTFKVYGNYSNRTDTLYRLGTVLLLRSYNSLSAVSMLDRRVIWSRDLGAEKRFVSAESESFRQFNREKHVLPSESTYVSGPVRLVGAGARWICLQHHNRVEVVDVLSGRTLWTLAALEVGANVIASERCVFVSQADGSYLCLRTQTGEVAAVKPTAEALSTAIRGVETQIVRWKSGRDGAANSLEWIGAESGIVERTVPLTGMTHFRFLDDQTLVGFSERQAMQLVDLDSGEVEVAEFQSDAEPTVAGPQSILPAGENAWDPSGIRIAADALNYYLTESPEGLEAQNFSQPSGRELMRFRGEVRAVDRSTGKLRWRVVASHDQMAATDQPTLPVLVLVEKDSADGNLRDRSLARNELRAIHKVSGEMLFEQVIPSSFGLRLLELQTPEANVLDVSVYGNRVRILGEASQR